jgi:hypothetical protein
MEPIDLRPGSLHPESVRQSSMKRFQVAKIKRQMLWQIYGTGGLQSSKYNVPP